MTSSIRPYSTRLGRGHEVVAVGVGGDALERLAAVVGEDLLDALLQVEHLAGADLDVGGLAAELAGPDLVDQDLRVRQRGALALRARGEETEPIDIAVPTQIVRMSGLTKVIVS